MSRHVLLQLRDGVSKGLPLVGAPLASLHHVALDVGAAVVLRRLPGQEDTVGALISPLQVLGRIGHSWGTEQPNEGDSSYLDVRSPSILVLTLC